MVDMNSIIAGNTDIVHAFMGKVDSEQAIMDLFALPYKAVVLRLVECGVITVENARILPGVDPENISVRIELTGKSERWQKNSNCVLYFWKSS